MVSGRIQAALRRTVGCGRLGDALARDAQVVGAHFAGAMAGALEGFAGRRRAMAADAGARYWATIGCERIQRLSMVYPTMRKIIGYWLSTALRAVS